MGKNICYNCGQERTYSQINPVDQALIETWALSPCLAKLFNIREGSICVHCGANMRAQGLAKAILMSKYGFEKKSLKEWVIAANSKDLKVCELNSCHELHKTLSGLKGLTYAEYGTESEEDIESLSYAPNTYDIVLHSETLEHVSNPKQAMRECRRVIKTNGIILFTVPIIWNRKTRKRASLDKGKIVKLLPASYHGKRTDDYLVFNEFGNDIDKILSSKVAFSNPSSQNFVFCSTKKPERINKIQKAYLKVAERKVCAKQTGRAKIK